MALVEYDYSDSESEVESENEKMNEHEICVLFHTLPQPKQQVVVEEEEDDVLLKKSVPKKNVPENEKMNENEICVLFHTLPQPKQQVVIEEEDDILLKKSVPKKNVPENEKMNENEICVLFHTLPQPKKQVVIEEDEDDILLKKSVPKKNVPENEKMDENEICVLFHTLPQPKQQVVTKEEDDILLKKSVPKKSGVKEPVKIAIPALSNYNSDEEEPPKKIINKPSAVKATGLFAILPSPKCTPVERNSKFDANVVKQKNLVPRTVTAKAAAAKRQYDSDDDDAPSSNFFSFTDTTKVNAGPVAVSSTLNMQIDSAKPVKDMNSKSNAFFSDLVANAAKTDVPENPDEEETDTLEKNAVEELCGKRQKKAKKNDVNYIDINADDVMPDPREWRTKALTEEAPSAAVKKGEEPSLQSRRKHQITYLAYQAKVNEQELKNQWAMNRMTRKQTQAKYGF